MEEFQKKIQELDTPVEVVISDIGLPGMSGIEGVKWIKRQYPSTEVIMLSVFTDTDNIYKALCSGAVGYLQKNTPLSELYKSIEAVIQGGSHDTRYRAITQKDCY